MLLLHQERVKLHFQIKIVSTNTLYNTCYKHRNGYQLCVEYYKDAVMLNIERLHLFISSQSFSPCLVPDSIEVDTTLHSMVMQVLLPTEPSCSRAAAELLSIAHLVKVIFIAHNAEPTSIALHRCLDVHCRLS